MQFDFEVTRTVAGLPIDVTGTVEFEIDEADGTWAVDEITVDRHDEAPGSAPVHVRYNWRSRGEARGEFLALKDLIEDAYAERIAFENSFLPQEKPYSVRVL
jgi:hypothetical protein